MITELKILGAVFALALAFIFGFNVADDRAKLALAERDRNDNATALALQKQLDVERQTKADKIAAIDTEQTRKLNDALDENNRLKRGIADGSIGLRIVGAKCPAAGNMPGTGQSPGMGVGASPELDAVARQDYYALRDGIAYKERQLEACQGMLAAQ